MKVLNWIWSALKKAGRWLLDNPIAIAGAVGAAVGAWFMWKSNQNKIASLEDAAAVAALKRKIAADEAKAEILEKKADAAEPEVTALKNEIAASKRRVVEIHEGEKLENKSDEEIADIFSRSRL